LAPLGFLFAGVINHLHDCCHIDINRAALKVSGKLRIMRV
jgi:hypothetical protein